VVVAGTKRHPGHVAVVFGLVAITAAEALFTTVTHRSPRTWVAGAAAALSLGLILVLGAPVLGLLRRLSVIDIPTHRSSHTRPTPRGGGLAVLLVVLGCAATGALGRPPAVVWVCGAIGCLGLAEDLLAVSRLGSIPTGAGFGSLAGCVLGCRVRERVQLYGRD
jgi:UDP-N-acetylmuramyl pentapeptide phosphotransferase/UDP-N-acetylglucosamine-1-phosphate transferase